MQKQKLFRIVLSISLLWLPSVATASAEIGRPATNGSEQSLPSGQSITQAGSPLLFIQNNGQFDPHVRFQLREGERTWWFTDDGIWLTVLKSDPGPGTIDHSRFEDHDPSSMVHGLSSAEGVNLRLTFPGLNPAAHMTASDPQPSKMNYFRGADETRWQANVPTFGAVRWENVYPGIHMVASRQPAANPRLGLAIEARPDADLSRLHLQIDGADAVRADEAGQIIAETAIGPITLPPLLTTTGDHLVTQSPCLLVPLSPAPRVLDPLRDPRREEGACPLVPLSSSSSSSSSLSSLTSPAPRPDEDKADLMYSTFLGGSGPVYADANDSGKGIAVDSSGSVYVAGSTPSNDFPTTPGAFQTTYQFGVDGFVSKLSPDGSSLVYSTFVGGTDFDSILALALGSDGSVYVTGQTNSTDFPTTQGAFNRRFRGGSSDAFVTKLNPTGSALSYSGYLGGPGSDYSTGIAVDGTGSSYTTGYTYSHTFPTTSGAFDTTHNGSSDAFITKLDTAGHSLVYSTFVGGSGRDQAFGIAVDADGTAIIGGQAGSGDFPTTVDAFSRTLNGGSDAFVTKMNATGSALVYSTFLGGSTSEAVNGVQIGPDGTAYVVGETDGLDYPTTPGAYDTTENGYLDIFVTRLSLDGSHLIYSTFLGGARALGDEGFALAVDNIGQAYVTGRVASNDYPTTIGAYTRTANGSREVIVSKLSTDGSTLMYSTYLGGNLNEKGNAITVDALGAAYVTGDTSSEDFPTTPGSFDPGGSQDQDAFIAKFNMFLEATATAVTDSGPGGNHNGYPDPGETGLGLQQTLTNSGPATLTGVAARLVSLTPGISISNDTALYANIPSGQSITNLLPFTFAIDSSVACSTKLLFQEVVTTDQGTFTVLFSLITGAPQAPTSVFFDNVENGTNGWTTGGLNNTWGIITAQFFSPRHAWTDSPQSLYQNNSNSWLQTPVQDLSGKFGITYSGWYTYSLQAGVDNVYLEFSVDGGVNWNVSPLYRFNGSTSAWVQVSIDGTALENQPSVALRYRLFTDAANRQPGFTLDDVNLSTIPYICAPPR